MNSQNPISVCFRKYFDFKGRASKSEFWSFFFFLAIVYLVVGLPLATFDLSQGRENLPIAGLVIILIVILTFIPYIAVTARRLHDFGRSGWIQCIFLIIGYYADGFLGTGEVISWITTVIFFIYISQKSTPGENKFGSVPKK